jgi:RNA polymerase sigma-70 factor (ECF subfamily)
MGFSDVGESFRRLVEENYAQLYRYAFRLSGRPDTAADLTQETFVRAQAQFGQLRDPSKARPWLFAILRNAYLQNLRSERTRREVPLDVVEKEDGPSNQSAGVDIEPEKLQAVLNELPEVFRTPVILFYFRELSYREIADILNVPIGTVMSRLARGKEYLRKRLVEDKN